MNVAIDTPLDSSTAQLTDWLERLEQSLAQGDLNATLALFGDECYWRDLLLFSWNLITLEGKPAIRDMLENRLAQTRPEHWKVEGTAT